ncbi:MAG TPA: serine/threonine-protein kinase, partial [Steroidobacteraceae bacterium]|nr:serine/threonine-protein kinase [Steroidobacteraceae bacterium]
ASEQDLKDHVVIVGHAGERVATPVAHSQPLAHVVAAAVASVLEQQVIARPGWARALEWLAAVLVIAFAGFVIPKLGPWTSLAATAIVAVSCIAVALFALAFADVWIALAVPAAAVLTGWGAAQAAFLDVTRSPATPQVTMATGAPLQTESVLQLAQTFRSQGRLELAFEALRQCAGEARILDALYELGVEFECSGDTARAATVFAHIANVDPAFRDASARIAVAHGLPTHGVSGAAESRPEAPLPLLPTDPAEVALDVQRLGRYEIESEIGKGAMGVVYLGRDPRINRVVAIKAIALADEFEEADLAEAKARFFREAEMAGRLNHPGIVTIYDVGESGRLAFIAMELLRGRHLSHYAESANLLPPEQVLELVARVAEALHYAHRQNVVHRDIKPANIMFDPDTDELKITDFGIARLTDTSRTKTGIVLGTPSFMSPEQLEGRRLDGRSDLFSLGVSLYQLLTGQLPFRAESMTRLMQKIATETHDPLRAVRPELPDSVERVVARALAKNPDDRFQTGAELAAALRDCAARLAA